jgi:hypothetical protein
MNEEHAKELYEEAKREILADPRMAEHILRTQRIVDEMKKADEHIPLYHEQKMAPRAVPDKFMMVFKSDPHLGDTVSSIHLNLATNEVTFIATETGDYKWTDWLINVPKEESVTLFLMDDTGKHRCILVMDDLYLFEHTCPVKNQPNAFGIDSPNNLEHSITVQFANIERLNQHQQSVTGSK